MFDTVNLRIFIINLTRDVEKKEHMQELCLKFDLNAEFIDAVYGCDISESDIAAVYSKEKAIDNIGRELSLGEVGCALSHKKIYKKMFDENINQALILEDDIEFDESLLQILAEKVKFTSNWDLVLLGHHTGASREIDTASTFWCQKRLSSKYKLVRPCEQAYGTYGYLVTKEGAQKLLNSLEKVSVPIDHLTGSSHSLNLYTVNPAPIRINKYLSTSFHSMEDRLELQKKHTALMSDKPVTTKKKFANNLGVYQLVVNLQVRLKLLINRLRPLRKYQ